MPSARALFRFEESEGLVIYTGYPVVRRLGNGNVLRPSRRIRSASPMLPPHKWSFIGPQEALEEISAEGTATAPLPCERLFSAANEAVLLVDTATLRIVQANPPAAALLRTTRAALIGSQFVAAFDPCSSTHVRRCIRAARASGNSDSTALRARGAKIDLNARLSLVRAAAESYLLVRLEPGVACERSVQGTGGSVVFESIDGAPVGFLITEAGFHIDYANRAFVEMAGVESEAEMRGSPLARWLNLSAMDLDRLAQQLSQREATTRLTSDLCSARSPPRRVEICAVPVPDGEHTWWGFTISHLPRLN